MDFEMVEMWQKRVVCLWGKKAGRDEMGAASAYHCDLGFNVYGKIDN
jgi:hypothetical protein